MTIDTSPEVSGVAPAKLALAAALKRALHTVPLSRVTVSGLAEAAGVHRQTFYAHFHDVYDLAAWTFTADIGDRLLIDAGHDTWAEALVVFLRYLRANRDEAVSVIDSLSHRELELFLYHSLRRMTRAVTDDVQGELRVRPDDREFIVDHYTLAVLGHVTHWITTGMRDDPQLLVDRLEFVMHGQVRESLERAARRARDHRASGHRESRAPDHRRAAPSTDVRT